MAGTDAGRDVGEVFFEEGRVTREGADKVLAGDGGEGCCEADVGVCFEKGECCGEGYYLEESAI